MHEKAHFSFDHYNRLILSFSSINPKRFESVINSYLFWYQMIHLIYFGKYKKGDNKPDLFCAQSKQKISRVKKILEKLSRTWFLTQFEFPLLSLVLRSREEKCGTFKYRKQSCSWKLFEYCFPSKIGFIFLQKPLLFHIANVTLRSHSNNSQAKQNLWLILLL